MAYQGGIGGTFKNLWSPDLTTRAGAQSAMDSASTVFSIVAGFRAVGVFLTAGVGPYLAAIAEGNVIALMIAGEIALMIVAAVMLRRGRGLIFAVIGAILYFLGLLANGNILSWVIGALLLGAMVGGIRGARAMSRNTGFDDELVDTFS